VSLLNGALCAEHCGMKWSDLLERWGLSSLRINAGVLGMEWQPSDPDRNAAWELYVELLTRVTTQGIAPDHGDEATALKSIYDLFDLTRQTLKANRGCDEFAKLAVVVLNQIIRPFTARWHRLSLANAFADPARCQEFRTELVALQQKLRKYTKALADIAGVEDLTTLESEGN
jgi:hypothetical protein